MKLRTKHLLIDHSTITLAYIIFAISYLECHLIQSNIKLIGFLTLLVASAIILLERVHKTQKRA